MKFTFHVSPSIKNNLSTQRIMKELSLSLLVVLLIGSTVCMAQDRQKGKVDREKRIEQIITDLGLNEKQAKDFKAAMEEMRPTKRNSNERPSREEMQKKRKEGEAKIKSILTDEQYKKYQDMRKKENADRKKKIWRTIIQMLPSSYMQKRTWTGNYAILRAQNEQREGVNWRNKSSVTSCATDFD